MKDKTYELSIISGVEGKCISLNDYRIAGGKPWGGGKVLQTWEVTLADLKEAISELSEVDNEG